MSKDTTIYVTIGRNVDGKPMHVKDWHDFAAAVASQVEAQHGDIFLRAYGVGEYEGVKEDSFVVGATINDGMIHNLRIMLSTLAGLFDQDCIGLVAGTTDFIKGTEYAP